MESSCRITISCNVDKTEKRTIGKIVKRKGKLAALLRARHDAEVRMREEIEIKERERLEWLQKQKTHKPSMTFTGTDKIQNVINYFACPKGRASFIHFFLTDRFIHDSFIHEKPSFCQKSILSTFENFAQNTVLSTFFANETFTRSFRHINHSSL